MIYTITETIVRVVESNNPNHLLYKSKKDGIVIIHKCIYDKSDKRDIELLTEYRKNKCQIIKKN